MDRAVGVGQCCRDGGTIKGTHDAKILSIVIFQLLSIHYFHVMNPIIPPTLQPGDHIALISPSRFGEPEHLALARTWAESHGWHLVTAPNYGHRHHQMGGTVSERVEDFHWAVEDPRIKAIWSVRGGYGAVQIVDRIDWGGLLRDPKWLIGFSDSTVLLQHALQLGLASAHAWMPIPSVNVSQDTKDSLAQVLSGNWKGLCAPTHPFQKEGEAQGRLVGGNLSVLYSLLGSESFPNLDGAILVLEDLDEYLYHIDRMLMGLARSGALDNVAGIAVGGLSDMNDNVVPFGENAEEIMHRMLPSTIPVAFNMPIGHAFENQAFINGCDVVFRVDSEGASITPIT